MKRLVLLLAAAAALLAPAAGVRAPARQLHDQPLQPRSRSRGTGSTSSTCSTWPRSRPSRPAASTPRAYARRIAANAHLDGRRPAGTARPARARRSRTRPARAACARRGSRSSSPGPKLDGAARSPTATPTTPTASAGRRSSSARRTPSTSDELRAYPKDLLSEPARRHVRPRRGSRRAGPDVPPALSRGKALEAPDRVADAGFASLVGRSHLSAARDPRLARRRALLGRRARALARPRQDDRHRLPRRPARHAAPRGPARPDRHGHAHDRRLRARPRDARALAVHRPGPALPVAEPRLGPARRRRSAPRCSARAGAAARTRTATPPSPPPRTSAGHRASARCSPSASRAGCCRARRRSSSCSRRSRCTGSRSACC